jgi:hypothetical protein
MSNEQKANITLDQTALLGPVMAAQILNAYYSALLLKQQKGIELTPEIEQETLTEVFLLWANIQTFLEEKIPKKLKPLGTSEHR